jgi:hypothetical protein
MARFRQGTVRRLCVLIAWSGLAAFVVSGCDSGTSTPTLSSAGLDGVRPGMSFAAVQRKWKGLAVVFPNSEASGADIASSSYCAAGTPVVLGFWTFPGGLQQSASNNGAFKKKLAELFFLWAFGTVRTKDGIHIGSTSRQLRSAYGSRLQPVEQFHAVPLSYRVLKVVEPGTSSPKIALIFGLAESYVVAIGLSENYSASRAIDTLNNIFDGYC